MLVKPEIINKGWGTETIIHNSELYCGKILTLLRGKEGSAHFHMNKTETWYLIEGRIMVYITDKETANVETFEFTPGKIIHLPAGTVHKMKAVDDSTIFEVSTFHEDSDTYRVGKGDSQK